MEELRVDQKLKTFEKRVDIKFEEFDKLKSDYDKTIPALNTYARNSLKNEITIDRNDYIAQQRKAIETGLKKQISHKTSQEEI